LPLIRALPSFGPDSALRKGERGHLGRAPTSLFSLTAPVSGSRKCCYGMTKVLPPVGAVKGVALPIVFLSIDGLGAGVMRKFPQEEQ
jgi:hypothetical protein